jgi:hypothetical protein
VTARLIGGRADGQVVQVPEVERMWVVVAMVDGLPLRPPQYPDEEGCALLERAWGCWEIYRHNDESEPDQTGVLAYECVRPVDDRPSPVVGLEPVRRDLRRR